MGGNEGPLLGLIATTDDRLQTITLVGTPDLIKVAETYIKQLDLRQRQVALTVRLLDVRFLMEQQSTIVGRLDKIINLLSMLAVNY